MKLMNDFMLSDRLRVVHVEEVGPGQRRDQGTRAAVLLVDRHRPQQQTLQPGEDLQVDPRSTPRPIYNVATLAI